MPAATRSRARLSVVGLLEACGGVLAVATIAGFAGRFSWALDLFAHFRPHYAVLLLAGVAAGWWLKRPWTASLCGLGAVLNLAIIGSVTSVSPVTRHSGAPHLQLLSSNVKTDNSNVAALLNDRPQKNRGKSPQGVPGLNP